MQPSKTNPIELLSDERLRETVLFLFCQLPPSDTAALGNLSDAQWKRLLYWLDTSGLALYFLDRLTDLDRCDLLPAEVQSRLEQNLADNTARIRGMIGEQTAIQRGFQKMAVSYAILKGFSLFPSSLPKPELRSQLDLDFLVAERCAPRARQILEERGYHLHAISGRCWEFKAENAKRTSLKEMYRETAHRSVELHLESNESSAKSLLSRIEKRPLGGICSPVLSPVDLFLGQGLHLCKHVCSEFSRTAHLVEFRRHILNRYSDDNFWRELRSAAEQDPQAPMSLGIVILLISHVMGHFAPEALTSWTIDTCPSYARLWVELYGRRSVFATFPGNKLYLLLQRELASAGIPQKWSLRRALLPLSLPRPYLHAPIGESSRQRIRRYRAHLSFVAFRLRFHCVEGLRYSVASIGWRRRLNGLTS